VKVLAVDDDAVAALALQGMVTKLGHECVVARSGAEAWSLLQGGAFDVTVTDRAMPDMDGLELCRKIRADAQVGDGYVYIVLASALGDDEQARDGMLAGADDYIVKPLRLRQLELKLIAGRRVTTLHRQLTGLNDDLRTTTINDAESNRRLTEANQVQADMMVMIGHDARQPLSGVIGYIEATLEEWENTPDDIRRANLTKAASAAHRVDQLIEDVLTMGSLDAGTITAKPESVPVRQIIEEAIESAGGGVPITLLADAADRALVDPWHLRQIVANLIGNAVKYGMAPITVTVRPADHAVEIVVCDSGEGVPRDFVPHLFERFTRAETGIATRKHGTGFGLYIVCSLIKANHGRITYHPGEPAGACFTVRLPIG
jgi:signal transduction histidine kinase